MKAFICTIVGLGLGGVAGYFIGHITTKKKYCNLADKEVNSVKESLSKYYEEKLQKTPNFEAKKPKKAAKIERAKVDVPVKDASSINHDILKNNNEEVAYKKYVKMYKSEEKEGPEKENEPLLKPYVISPEEFSEGTYDVQTLNYYKDGILADDCYNIVKDVKGTVGDEALNSFGMYEEDSVYVRNEEYQMDYEILFVDDTFANAAPKGVPTFPGQDDE